MSENVTIPRKKSPVKDPEHTLSPYHSVPESGEAKGVGLGADVERAASKNSHYFEEEADASDLNAVPRSFHSDPRRKSLICTMYMSIAAIVGCFLRIALAQLFGEECQNPGSVGWLKASSPLCVTADGEAVAMNGIIFADFPSNMLGSFLMGLMLSGDALELPLGVPIAWLSPDSYFQDWDAVHLAIRTGFCGSLTTFSSWNSDMVVVMYATGASNAHSQIVRALFGYLIGMETALGSFAFGKKVAIWVHRYTNPTLAQEADATVERKEQGVYIHRELPEFERRFLPNLQMYNVESCDPHLVVELERWRASTVEARRVGSDHLFALVEIERCFLVEKQPITPDLKTIASNCRWDIDALAEWVRQRGEGDLPSIKKKPPHESSLLRAAIIFFIIFTLLLIGLLWINGENDYDITYRTMIYSGLLAPFGAILRWKLSTLNKTLGGEWSWLPVGTLSANLLGCIVSIISVAMCYHYELYPAGIYEDFWVIGTLRAIRVGFAGCLTTVSTFVSEVHAMNNSKLRQERGYVYMLITIGSSSAAAVLLYGLMINM